MRMLPLCPLITSDIAHRDAMSEITVAEDREFLRAQREEVRRDTVITARGMILACGEEQQRRDAKKKEQRMKRPQSEKRKLEETTKLASSSTSSSSTSSPTHTSFQCRGAEEHADGCVAVTTPPIKRIRGSK